MEPKDSRSQDPLDPRAQQIAQAWDLTDPVILARTPMGLVQRVTCADGTFAVLKCLSEVGQREEGPAPAVLRAFDGDGMVRLLRACTDAHLVEYCDGPNAQDTEGGPADRGAIPILLKVIGALHARHIDRPADVPTLRDRCMVLDWGIAQVAGAEAQLFDEARRTANDLLSDQRPRLLHGDFHHENVLRGSRPEGPTWLAIDPQGLWGDPAYEVANLFGNPRDFPQITLAPGRPTRLAGQIHRSLGYPIQRILGWAFVHACISAAWAIEDGKDLRYRLRIAALVRDDM